MKTRHQPRKRFGQNFLHDQGVIDRIISSINAKPDDHIIEIGPGQGALTRRLATTGCRLTVIELDRDLVASLSAESALAQVAIVSADALSIDLTGLAGDQQIRLVGNLPYNISTPLIFHALDNSDRIADTHFMLQKEVVERMAAAPGGRDYGRLSVMLQYRCEVESLFVVKPGAFFPAPRVNSAVVRLTPRSRIEHPAHDAGLLAQVVRVAFSQRRKTLSNSLKTLIDAKRIESLGIDPRLRAEALAVADFVAIANLISGTLP